MAGDSLLSERRADGSAWITLNRPEVHNAFDDRLIVELTAALSNLGADDAVRAVVLTGSGRSFSAGADLNWMRRSSTYGEAENMADARALAILMKTLHELPKPTVARVNGAALGGGAGLVACCDIAVASADARFGTTEVRLGLIPAAIGLRQARRLMLTGERIAAAEAARIGLVHDVVPPERLDAAVAALLEDLLKGGPGALAAVKRLLRDLTGRPIDVELVDDTARRIAALRTTAEAQEGVAAFLAKRQPVWLS